MEIWKSRVDHTIGNLKRALVNIGKKENNIEISTTTSKKEEEEEEEEYMDEMDPDTEFEDVPNCVASRMWWPVCASNGKNYANLDIFECARKKEPDLYIVNEDGPCNSSVERNEIKRR
ncbi:hypothetical protein Anas_07522 [Armadillidium nasatum]|uniref:Kazal-like domain-containing protein n=1 Tax=Armadillidium nasatum TaxID=96803 RepID=A0A5N5SM87_9CRUS|nr:hypothetical protein Anas_07522 [Armadillidium nasatum]